MAAWFGDEEERGLLVNSSVLISKVHLCGKGTINAACLYLWHPVLDTFIEERANE